MNFGISQSYISRLEKKIINKMKKEIASKIGWDKGDRAKMSHKFVEACRINAKIQNIVGN